MKFKELLKELDISGAQLARKLGLTSAAVAKWCNEEASPPCSRMNDIANALNVPVTRVVGCFVSGIDNKRGK